MALIAALLIGTAFMAVLFSNITLHFTGDYTLSHAVQSLKITALYGLFQKQAALKKKNTKQPAFLQGRNVLRIIKRLLRKTKVKKLYVRVDVGAEDAFAAALFAGSISVLLYSLDAALLPHNPKCAASAIRVVPHFQKALFHAQIDCIISVSVVHIISTIFAAWKGERKHASH